MMVPIMSPVDVFKKSLSEREYTLVPASGELPLSVIVSPFRVNKVLLLISCLQFTVTAFPISLKNCNYRSKHEGKFNKIYVHV